MTQSLQKISFPDMLLFVFLYILLYRRVEGANIAAGKNVTCDAYHLPPAITDGDFDIDNPVVVKRACSALLVQLMDEYYINYVHVFDAVKPKELGKVIRNWDYFNVYLRNDFGGIHDCGTYQKLSSPAIFKIGLRVNCVGWDKPFKFVEVASSVNYGYAIAEIEVHSVGKGLPRLGALLYKGCLKKFYVMLKLPGHSIITCAYQCVLYSFFAMKEKLCHCFKDYKLYDEIETKRCYYKCPVEPDQYCGGKIGYSFYLSHFQLPFYYGCMPGNLNCTNRICTVDYKMTVEKCIAFCNDSRFALLQGHLCLCDDVEGLRPVYYKKCTRNCTGNPDDICGGNNTHTKYSTCTSVFNLMPCSVLIQCSSFIDKYGNCRGRCLPGYMGEYCLERDLRTVLFDYEYQEPTTPTTSTTTATTTTTTALITTTLTTTVTTTTTTKTTTLTTTTVTIKPTLKTYIDACDRMEPCKKDNKSICISLPNEEYICQCVPGYSKKDSNTRCEDIDECNMEESVCDPETTKCKNYLGFYECDCKDGFTNDEFDICTMNVSAVTGVEYDTDSHAMAWFYVACLGLIAVLLAIYFYDTAIDVDDEE